MPSVGLEPTRRKAPVPKTGMSTNSTTKAFFVIIKILLVVVNNSLNRYEFAFDYDTAFLPVLLSMAQNFARKQPLVTQLFYL